MTQQTICPFFNRCGGCSYQDIPFDAYLEKKRQFVLNAFRDKSLRPEVQKIIPVPLKTRRRAGFSFRGNKVGFNALKSREIVEITDCMMLTPALAALPDILRKSPALTGRKGDIFVRDTPYGPDIHIKCEREKLTLALTEDLLTLAHETHAVRLLFNFEPILQTQSFSLLAEDFLQPSAEGEQILIDLLLNEATGCQKAVDLFCGCGTFTRPLLEKKIQTTGYDLTPNATCLLDKNGVARDLFRNPLTSEELDGIDLIVMDPPRAGALAQTTALAEGHYQKIVMISCNPATAARDAKILTDAHWHLHPLILIDQFTYSKHIEIFCVFTKESRKE